MYPRDLGMMIIKSIIAVALLATIIYLMAIDRLFGIVVILGIVASMRVPLIKKMHRPTPSFKKHTVPPGLMHQQARGKTRRSRVEGPPFRWR